MFLPSKMDVVSNNNVERDVITDDVSKTVANNNVCLNLHGIYEGQQIL